MNKFLLHRIFITKEVLRFLWVFIIIIASLSTQGQDIAGEMDLIKDPINNANNPGTAELFTDADIKLYPNPAANLILINSKVKLKEGVILTLSDIRGNILEKRILGNNITDNDYAFDLRQYSNGQYIINILSKDGAFVTKKLIKRS